MEGCPCLPINLDMLVVISATCLLYAACALLYQADKRRAVFANVKSSKRIRYGMRAGAAALFIATLYLLAPLQGWERGVPIWLGLLTLVFVAGLFLGAQKPELHVPAAMGASGIGIIAVLGAILL